MAGEDTLTGTEGAAGAASGGETQHWSEGLSDENRQSPLFERYREKSLDDFFDGYRNVEKYVGRSRIEAPSDDWDDSKWNEFHARTGRPETPDQYELGELPDSLKDTWDAEFEKGIIESAHKAGLSKRQMSAIREAYVSLVDQNVREEQLASENTRVLWQDEIRREWGRESETGIAQARRALGLAGNPDELGQVLHDAGIDGHPAIMRYLRQVDALTQAEAPGISAQTQAAAQGELQAVMQSEAYFDDRHPDHTEVRERANHLFRIGSGG